MPKLTDILNNTNSRVGALENESLDDAAGVTRISKLYTGIKLTATVTRTIVQYATPDDDLYPTTDTWANELNML